MNVYFNKVIGACNDKDLPQFDGVYKLPFYHAKGEDGAAIVNKKHHCYDLLPEDVVYMAPCQLSGYLSYATDLGKPNGIHFMPEEQCDSMSDSDCGRKASKASFGV
jgi:hypothetical protein